MSVIKERIVKIVLKNKYTSSWYNKYIDNKTIKYLENLIKMRSRKYNSEISRNIYLLLEPEHDNIGDHAIAYAEEQFLENTTEDYNIFYLTEREYKLYKKYLRKIIKKDDIQISNYKIHDVENELKNFKLALEKLKNEIKEISEIHLCQEVSLLSYLCLHLGTN